MARISIILAVVLFCILSARAPDPRVAAAIDALSNHSHQIPDAADGSYYCPMDPDIRSIEPGRCPRCGMKLVEGSSDIVESRLDLTLQPASPRVAEPTRKRRLPAIKLRLRSGATHAATLSQYDGRGLYDTE